MNYSNYLVMNTLNKLTVALLFLLASFGATAQETQSRHAVPGQRYLKEYWGRSELYLQHQAYYMLDLADKALDANPPSLKIGREREMAFLMLDAVVHEPAPIDNPAVLEFLSGRMNKVLEDLDKPLKGRKSLRIYKLYNCGMLFRHNHGDHFDSHVRDFCHKAGVPVFGTEETFKNDIQVRHIRHDDLYTFEENLPKGKITVNVLPGHQDALQNNIWIITLPNGKVVGATGDQWLSGGEDLKWLKDIHLRLPKIDVLAMDCWIHDFDEHIADFSPRLLVSQHENEIGAHGIDHREAYWMTMFKNTKVHQSQVPWILMAWGEWFDY